MFRIFDQYVSRKTLFLVLGDAVSIAGSLVLAYRIRFWNDSEGFAFFTKQPDLLIKSLTIVLAFQVCAYYNELYQVEGRLTTADQFFRLAQATGVGCFFLSAVYYLAPQLNVGRGVFALTLLLVLVTTTTFRFLTDITWRSALTKRPVLIVGTDSVARKLADEIEPREDLGMNLVGFVGLAAGSEELPGQYLGATTEIDALVKTYGVRSVFVSDGGLEGDLPVDALLRLRTRGIQIEDARSALAGFTGRISVDTVRSPWFIYSAGFSRNDYAMAFKRLTDLLLSAVGLILALPIMALVAVAVRIDSPGPVLYLQERTGLNGRLFNVFKFRTMRADAEIDGVAQWAQADDPRITRIGRFLRIYRLDELPQFINVIRGQMSFVGPRPERPEFIHQILAVEPLYSERHTLRPGLTGWAQVCYPYGANLEDAIRKLEYDLFYLKNVSFLFDMAIVFQTVKIVIWGRGR